MRGGGRRGGGNVVEQAPRFSSERALSILPAASVWDPTMWSFRSFSLQDIELTNTGNEDASQPIILASSAILATEVTGISKLIRDVARWLHEFFLKCYDAALLTLRGSEVVLRLSPLIILTPASMAAAHFLGASSDNHHHNNHSNFVSDLTWNYFTSSMQALGPAFVKLCQWVATRRDIFPPNVCDRLSRLHDRGIPHSWKYTQSVLTEAFGADYAEKGLSVDEQVIGCGSAAQVHTGRLKTRNSEGEWEEIPVAVKILHPRFEALVGRDLWFMQAVANLLHSLPIESFRMINFPRAASNFGKVLYRQADLVIEGENLKQFRSNFYRDGNDEKESSIVFPRPMDGWISTNVLVEELVTNAIPVAEYLRDHTDEGTAVRKELAGPLLRAFLKMVFLDNFVHCDLHPGNVLIQTTSVLPEKVSVGFFDFLTGKTSAEPEEYLKRTIVFLDAGIATSLEPNDQRNLHDLFRAVILNDGDRAGRLMVERAKYERCSSTPGGVDAFAQGIAELVSEFHDRRKDGLTLGAVRIGSLLSRVLDLCRVHGVEIDPAMASIVISTLVLEGLGRSLEPSLNLIDFAVPFVIGRGRV